MEQHLREEFLVPAGLGAALGLLGATVLFVGSGLVLLPWAVVGALLGAWRPTRRSALRAGAVYGFVLALVFMIASYDGHTGAGAVVLLVLACSCVGAVCGGVLAMLGRALKR
ncbi:MAG: hypothetical protein ACJ72E_08595 [Marmoricola sp.]